MTSGPRSGCAPCWSAARERRAVDGRAIAVAGDVVSPGLGLLSRRRDGLAERVGWIIHCAASVSFTLGSRGIAGDQRRRHPPRCSTSPSSAQARGGLDGFTHVSTAYVAGTHAGEFTEDDLDVGQGFRNSYERSKFEAEQLVRARRRGCRRRSCARASSSATRTPAGRRPSTSSTGRCARSPAAPLGRDPRPPLGAGRRRAGRLRRRRRCSRCAAGPARPRTSPRPTTPAASAS